MRGRLTSMSLPARALQMSLMDSKLCSLFSTGTVQPLIVQGGCKSGRPATGATCATGSISRNAWEFASAFSDAQGILATRTRNFSSLLRCKSPTQSSRIILAICSASRNDRQHAFASAGVQGNHGIRTRNLSSVSNAVQDVAEGETEIQPALSSQEFKAYMAEVLKSVNTALDREVFVRHPELVTQAMRYTLLAGGKRVCSMLCITACELVGGTREAALPVSCAMEMIKDAHLIHDDLPCVDNADIRRGQTASHKKFGEGVAVYAGDSLLVRAFEHIARNVRADPEKVLRAIALVARASGSEGMAGGQVMDLMNSDDANVSLEDLEDIHLHKTAKFAETAARCGAVLGGGSEEEIERMGRYGRNVGLLFQVVDDILDVTGSAEQMGKPTGKDTSFNKATYVTFLGLEGAREMAVDLNRKAKEDLRNFDKLRVAPLVGVADFILQRGL